MMWFDKQHPEVDFCDIRSEIHDLTDRYIEINPDIVADFRELPMPDNTYRLVVLDPPHLSKLGDNSWTAKKYGKLLPSWESDIRAGFEECMRVLKPGGTLIFKWNEYEIPMARVIKAIGSQPLFGHRSGKNSKTIWMTFLKEE